MKFYKIKVGIESFDVNEDDIPRIVEAMKTNSIVKLDCGLFRGQAILAVYRDEEKEVAQVLLESSAITDPEKIKELENQEKLKKQRQECLLCEHSGWKVIVKDNKEVAIPCSCQKLPK